MTKNTAIVLMYAVGMVSSLCLIFGTAYLAVNYSLWWLLLLIILSGIKMPMAGGLK